MKHSDFHIGYTFTCENKVWLCTDIGSRVIIAICLSASQDNDYCRALSNNQQDELWKRRNPIADISWITGPPYAFEEHVFDERGMLACKC